MSYWEKRKEHDMYEAMKSAEETSQEIAEIYARASRELNYQISKIYERYRDKYDMTDEEALRLLNAMKDPADIDELKMKLQGLEGEAAKEILKELESPAYRARIKRLENLQDEIDRKMKEVYKQEKKISTDHYIDQYQQSYYREIFDTKKMTGLDFSFSKVDPKRLDKVLHSNWSGANYSKRIWNNTEELAEDLKKEISLAYLTGKAERDIAHDIALKYATGASNARRLVRTESAYISGQAQAAADEECGIDKYRIVATLDLRTSKICQEMDGKEFAYKDMKVGENYPPFHPYCRTTVISVLDDQDLDVLQRRARDPETGKNKTFPASMTYKEWYAQEVEGKGVGQSTDNAPQEPKKPEVSEETRQQMSERRKQRAAERAAKQASVPINKQGQEIEFDLPANIADEDRRKRAIARNEKIKELITNMANEYDTNLTKVKRGAEKAAGEVDLAGVMGLSDSHPETVLHEFAHSMASTDRIKAELADDKEKEFMKELKKIRKRYEDARAKDPKISISAYSHHSLDEFYAEAFSHAKMKQLGLDKSWGYGDDYTFSDEVLELVDKYFKKESSTLAEEIKIDSIKGAGPDDVRVVNRQYVNSKKYHDAFEKLGYSKDTTEGCYAEAKRILKAANGTDIEYSTIIDERTGKAVLDKFGAALQENRVSFSAEEIEKINSYPNPLKVMHNHSRNGRPSGNDIIFYYKNKNISSSLILCHDGDIYELSNINRNIHIDKIYEGLYNSELRKRLNIAEEDPLPKDIAEHIVKECKVRATTGLYVLNKKKRMFNLRLVSHG